MENNGTQKVETHRVTITPLSCFAEADNGLPLVVQLCDAQTTT